MKKSLLALGMVCLSSQLALAQGTLIYSWENSVEGWGTLQANWTSGGFSSTTGVTAGNYSWILNAAASPDYAASLGGSASTSITAMLASSAAEVTVSVDVLATGFSYLQWDLTLNQNGGLGYASTDGYSYSQSPTIDSESTLTFSVPANLRATLAANPTLPTSLNFQIGGGNGGTVYLDNLVITVVPEPGALAVAVLVGAFLLPFLRQRRS